MENSAQKQLLAALAQAGERVNLYQAAEDLGLGRDEAQDLGTALMAEGLVEIVSLSGSVRVTDAGRLMLGGGGSGEADTLKALLADLDSDKGTGLSGKAASDAAQDMACLKAQLKRSAPLPEVVGACLAELVGALAQTGDPRDAALAARARALIKS